MLTRCAAETPFRAGKATRAGNGIELAFEGRSVTGILRLQHDGDASYKLDLVESAKAWQELDAWTKNVATSATRSHPDPVLTVEGVEIAEDDVAATIMMGFDRDLPGLLTKQRDLR